MNALSYKVIFSKKHNALVAVGENATANGKAASGAATRSQPSPATLLAKAVGVGGFVGSLCAVSLAVGFLVFSDAYLEPAGAQLAVTTLPSGGVVSSGTAGISTNGANMAIHQGSDKASINWNSFNVGSAASVNIVQPNTSAVLLNRVVGSDPSQVLGKINANGHVMLVNPNGIVFGKDGSVTATAFTASTLGISDADFQAGNYKFQRNGSTAEVLNQGTINTAAGGYVALLGAKVTNDGKIVSNGGNVVLAAGESVGLPADISIPVSRGGKVRLAMTAADINTAVNNTANGLIVTEGGQVLMQAATVGEALSTIAQSGRIDTSAAQAGAVTLRADEGYIRVDGSILANSATGQAGGDIIIGRHAAAGSDSAVLALATDASGAHLESRGGFVETSGEWLKVDGTTVQSKDWLLDPADINIVSDATADSNNWTPGIGNGTSRPNAGVGVSNIRASTIMSQLNNGTSVAIVTQNSGTSGGALGNITVSSAINKTSGGDASLSLIANNGIDVNANIGSTQGKLNLNLNATGGTQANAASSKGLTLANGVSILANGGDIVLDGTSQNAGAAVTLRNNTLSTTGSVDINGDNSSTRTTGGGVPWYFWRCWWQHRRHCADSRQNFKHQFQRGRGVPAGHHHLGQPHFHWGLDHRPWHGCCVGIQCE